MMSVYCLFVNVAARLAQPRHLALVSYKKFAYACLLHSGNLRFTSGFSGLIQSSDALNKKFGV
jgi:hypothetical protein